MTEEMKLMTDILPLVDVIVIATEVEVEKALNLKAEVDDNGGVDRGVKVEDEVETIDIKAVIIKEESAIIFVPDHDLYLITDGKLQVFDSYTHTLSMRNKQSVPSIANLLK